MTWKVCALKKKIAERQSRLKKLQGMLKKLRDMLKTSFKMQLKAELNMQQKEMKYPRTDCISL